MDVHFFKTSNHGNRDFSVVVCCCVSKNMAGNGKAILFALSTAFSLPKSFLFPCKQFQKKKWITVYFAISNNVYLAIKT